MNRQPDRHDWPAVAERLDEVAAHLAEGKTSRLWPKRTSTDIHTALTHVTDQAAEIDALRAQITEARNSWLDPRVERNLFFLVSDLCEAARKTEEHALFDATEHMERLRSFIDGRTMSATALLTARAEAAERRVGVLSEALTQIGAEEFVKYGREMYMTNPPRNVAVDRMQKIARAALASGSADRGGEEDHGSE